jgi:sulfate permease, SulP family
VTVTAGGLVARNDDKFVAMTTALAISTGLAALIAGLLRLGFLASFISSRSSRASSSGSH